MRSVVVVLPASMWAMIPMFLVFSSVYLRGIGFSLGLRSSAGMPARRALENEPFGGLSPCATVSWLAPSRAEQHKPPRDRPANIAGGLARLAACTAAFGALWAAPAAAQMRALAPRGGLDEAGPALAGGRVFWTRSTDRAVSVLAAPVDGGAPALVGAVRLRRPVALNLAAGPEALALRAAGRSDF